MKINIIDTHAHLYSNELLLNLDFIIQKSIKYGIQKIYIPCTNSKDLDKILSLKKKYPHYCKIMIGLHPNLVNNNFLTELKILKTYLDKDKFSAIGEIGLDFKSKKYLFDEQCFVFKTQILWAKNKFLPIIIHSREAFDETFHILNKYYKYKKIKGIFHCFSGSLEEAKIIIDYGLKLGIGGIITFKNCNLYKFLKKIDLKNIVLETDSPYLSPTPFRGKINKPYNLIFILEKLSQIYSISKYEIAKITTKNVKSIFSK